MAVLMLCSRQFPEVPREHPVYVRVPLSTTVFYTRGSVLPKLDIHL